MIIEINDLWYIKLGYDLYGPYENEECAEEELQHYIELRRSFEF